MGRFWTNDTVDSNALVAEADFASILCAFLRLPSPQLVQAIEDGSIVGGLRQLMEYLPLGDDARNDAVRALDAYASESQAPDLDELRRDYTRLFSHPKHPLVRQCEAAFLTKEGDELPLLAVNATARDADRLYRRSGYSRAQDTAIPADHILAELAFFEHMLGAAADATDARDERDADTADARDAEAQGQILERLGEFYLAHGATWWPRFFEQVEAGALSAQYRLVGALGKAVFGDIARD